MRVSLRSRGGGPWSRGRRVTDLRIHVFFSRGDAAKIFEFRLPVAGFLAVGFEHCVANMALFSLAVLDGSAGFRDFFRNVMFTVPGTVLGGGLLVGAVHRFIGGARQGRGSSPSVNSA
ncbi:formate/nitrite transporter family protein [Streptomyces sp. NPDC059355]|uniref:formate/nitrite transporter family protein n=1 Tax=Streptomyces sp. NPDC059355 TaxID=3346811 RepID=UPI0036A937EB